MESDPEETKKEVPSEPPTGREWSLGARIAIAATVAAVCVGVGIHLAMVFLHVAPSNTISKKNSTLIDHYAFPEFEQNWKLFAPNPLQQNIAVHARVQVRLPSGQRLTTGWVNLTGQDTKAIKHNPSPSHIDQNMLRRAFEFYTNSHDQQDKSLGNRGSISREYVLRIAAHRMGPELNGGKVQKIQLRSVATPVAPPKWSNENINTHPTTRVLPWWSLTERDFR
ncbi:DUF5819 family protein [Wenjunlia tyrosinilytica]|uniref:Uncharacterized protein n=1 Tax=Wenjunlia tyrosinilytica TaxID=1544741 RepID=A0A917ZNN0_9ACTN|nr:DUF5819 family protein [Wenjunlia tyrosinilytica]GGO86066.1 hypothetical protein GCM10012280_21300 [Wenjunlia tyrosinilytica]